MTSSGGSPTGRGRRRAARWTAARAPRRPRHNEIDWDRTIRANLRHYQPEHRTVIPERLVGHGRRRRSLAAELILCLDQSGSMAASVVHAGVLGASLASLPTLQTKVIAFDTAVVDLTDELGDPVDVLFGIQLGGGTDIDQALGYAQTLVSHPAKTVLILITDLYEGGDAESMLRRAASLIRSGVRLIVLLALSDDGAPGYDHELAAHVAALGAPVFACTPDRFPDMLGGGARGPRRQRLGRGRGDQRRVARRSAASTRTRSCSTARLSCDKVRRTFPRTIGAANRSDTHPHTPPGAPNWIRSSTRVSSPSTRIRQRPRWSMPVTEFHARSRSGANSTTSISPPTSADPTRISIR